MAKEKGQTPLEDEVVKVPKDKEQAIHEEDPRSRVVEPYQPRFLSLNALQRPSLRPNFGNSWKISRSCKSTSPSWMPSLRCPLMSCSSKKLYPTNGCFKSMLWSPSRRSVVQFFKTNSLPSLKIRVVCLYLV